MPTYSPDKLRRIREDGLLSPRAEHLQYLEELLTEVWDRSQFKRSDIPNVIPREQADAMAQANKQNLDWVFKELDARSKEYLAALGRMDNHRLSTYLKYQRTVPRRKRRVLDGE